MKYMGSKARIAKEILPIILKGRESNQHYVEPFVGGANCIDKVGGKRIGSDSNEYLIAMFKSLQDGWLPRKEISKEHYYDIKKNKSCYKKCVVGYVGFNCSYSGKWFGGYAGKVKTKINTERNYMLEAYNNVMNQLEGIRNIDFVVCNYYDLEIPSNSIIYCDPPYANTTKYKGDFDHEFFWQWCRNKHSEGHKIFVSEYLAPDDFNCIWEKQLKSSLSANGKIGGNKVSTEKLFTYKGN